MHNPVFEHSDTLPFALLACIILQIQAYRFYFCSVYKLHGDHRPETTSNGLVNRCILLINWISLCPFYQQ